MPDKMPFKTRERNFLTRLKILISFFLSITCFYSKAQTIDLKYVEYAFNNVVIHYDLLDSVEGRSYTIRLYSSADGFLNPVEKIQGDAGLTVKSGKNKTIIWIAKEELGATFKGKVALELRGRLFVPFINTESLDKYTVYKRKRKYNITWSGGTPQNILNFDLMKGDKKVLTFPNLANVSHHSLEFPGYIKPGNYKFKISDSKNKEEVVYTNSFKIRRKIPLALKAIPVIAIGAGVYFLLQPSPQGEPDIGGPPDPVKK
jgi:hypothetical protein